MEFTRSDVAVLINMLDGMMRRAKYHHDNGDISDTVYHEIIAPFHQRGFNAEINNTLDCILVDLLVEQA